MSIKTTEPVLTLHEGYTLKTGPPDPTSCYNLRLKTGLTPITKEQATAVCKGGAWCAYHIVHDATSTPVAMGRVIGDGAWYFHVIDMATLPEHQKKGLGKFILREMLAMIRREAPKGAYVNLLADEAGRKLYRDLGFENTGEGCLGMALTMRD